MGLFAIEIELAPGAKYHSVRAWGLAECGETHRAWWVADDIVVATEIRDELAALATEPVNSIDVIVEAIATTFHLLPAAVVGCDEGCRCREATRPARRPRDRAGSRTRLKAMTSSLRARDARESWARRDG